MNGSQVSLTTLVLVAPDGELPVEIKAAESHTTRMPSKAPEVTTGPLISGRYRDLGDGTLVDTRTGLQWMYCALGQSWDGRTCIGEAVSCNWDVLPGRVDTFNRQGGYGGHRDWRVPTIDELRTLVDKGSRNPATDRGAFPETRGWFLSSSPDANNSYRAWLVHFDSDGVHYSSTYHAGYVRLVRGRK